MYNNSKRLTACVLLFSHMLMSCWNPDLARKKVTTIQEEVHKQQPAKRHNQNNLPIHSASTTADGKHREAKNPTLPQSSFPIASEKEAMKPEQPNHAPTLTMPPSTKLPTLAQTNKATTQPGAQQWDKKVPTSASKQANTLAKSNALRASQRIAQTNREELIPKTEDGEAFKVPSPAIIPNQLPAREKLMPKTFIAQGRHQVSFIHSGDQWVARVNEHLPLGFSRRIDLPVYTEPGFSVEELAKHNPTWHQHHIHVYFPEQASDGQGYVYIGSVGLQGGGSNNSKSKSNTKSSDRKGKKKECRYPKDQWHQDGDYLVCPKDIHSEKKATPASRNNNSREKPSRRRETSPSRPWQRRPDSENIFRDIAGLLNLIFPSNNHGDDYDPSVKEEIEQMHAETEELIKEVEELGRQEAVAWAKQEEERRKRAEEISKNQEERWKLKLERHAANQGTTANSSKQKKIFIPDYAICAVEEIKDYAQFLEEKLDEISSNTPLPQEQQKDVKKILKRIDEEQTELDDLYEEIQRSLTQPDESNYIQYNEEDLNLAKQLLEELQELKEKMSKILAARNEQLSDYEYAPTSAESRELAAAYQELVKAFNDPVDNEELIANSQEQVQKLLHELSQQGRNDELLAQAQELSAGMAGLINMLKSQYSAIEDLYFDLDASDYIKQNVTEGWQQLKSLETTIRVTEKALIDLCVECWLPVPNLTQVPIISKVALKKAINALLDILVPGSEVVKAALGTRPMPQAPEEWADLAIEVGLDFIPFGKVLRLFGGTGKKLLHKKLKEFIVKLIEKRGKVARRATRSVNPYIGKSRKELLKSKDAYKKLIEEHQQKINTFKRDPIGNTAPEKLKELSADNPTRKVLLERAKARITALEKQLKKQQGELQKINEALNQ